MNTIIRVDKLCKVYENGKVKALNNVSFSVEEGTVTAIIGKSGCGKTTLLNMLGGLDVPNSGNIVIKNTDITSMPERKLSLFRAENIGFVFQFFNLIPEFTAEENILFPLAVSKMKIDEDYLNKLINVLEINEFRKRLPSELSGGQQQRVAIARALIRRPAIALMDEPTGNLDEESSNNISNLIQNLKNEFGQTILFVTHDIAMTGIADHIIKLRDGEVVDGGLQQ